MFKSLLEVRSKKGYTASYTSDDYATERMLVVKDKSGRVIGQRDPFFPGGVPVSAARRKRHIAQVTQEIIRDHEATQKKAVK